VEARSAKRWLAPFHNTPLHPQWLLNSSADWQDLRDLAGTVLDVGCADKRTQTRLPPACRYVGLDYPPTASHLYQTRPDVFGDAQALPFRTGTFDAVLLLHVLEHVPDPERAVAEAVRVLRAGGRVIVETPFVYPLHDAPFDFQRWTPRGLELLMTRHGAIVHTRRAAGRPAETGAMLFNLGLGFSVLGWVKRRNPLFILAPLIGVLVMVVNLIGWLVGRLDADQSTMPHRIRLVCEKTN
jgi:SAM-dependent methyltransferase